ncbi:MAG: hypothetical protein ACE5EI_06365 [Thermodesulfobacteriota bacterium]
MEEYTPEVTREHLGRGAKKVFRLGGLRLYECPLSYMTVDTAEVMRLVYLVDGSGALLHPGGWGGQPAWLVEACELYRVESARNIKDKSDG